MRYPDAKLPVVHQGKIGAVTEVRRLALGAVLLVLLSGSAQAQHVLDAKGRRYQCAPYDRRCSVRPPPGARLQALLDQQRQRPRPPKTEECGSRCDLLDRMK